MIKLGIACFMAGFVTGVFIVALLGWINEVREDKKLEKQLKELGVKDHG